MAQNSNRRFELLEAAILEQATVGRASAEAQVKALEVMTKKANKGDVKGVGKSETLKGSYEDARKPGVAGLRVDSAHNFLPEDKSIWIGQGLKKIK